MARAPRTYRAPIVVTLAAALIPACGSSSSDEGDSPATGGASSGGRATSGGSSSGGAGGSATGGKASGGAATGGLGGDSSSGGSGGEALPSCPDDYFFPSVSCVPGARCAMAADCTSGEERSFEFLCNTMGNSFTFQSPGGCENPYEYCDGIGNALCVEETWLYQGQGGNPPAPCPAELPGEGAECNAGAGFGADRDACGYPCGDAWTVTGCIANGEDPLGLGSWVGDGACAAGGAGGD